MSSRKTTRSRKRRNPASAPRAVASTRRRERAEREAVVEQQRRRGERQLGREGERPQSPFGGLPVSEVAILAGLVAFVVGLVSGGSVATVVGIIVCALGVVEVTAREHFAGYRSHTALLAGIPAVAVMAAVVAVFGQPHQRALLLLVVVPIFSGLFWLLRRRFLSARQMRVARPPVPRPRG